MCGEQIPLGLVRHFAEGSPPRVRGTGVLIFKWSEVQRITPACAGNSRGHRQPDRGNQDHPRVCGEQPGLRRGTAPGIGSPPRVRGTGGFSVVVGDEVGITPACAGNRGP